MQMQKATTTTAQLPLSKKKTKKTKKEPDAQPCVIVARALREGNVSASTLHQEECLLACLPACVRACLRASSGFFLFFFSFFF